MIKNMKNLSIFIGILILSASCKNEEQPIEIQGNANKITVTNEQFSSSKMEVGIPQEHTFEQTVHASGKIDVPPQHKAQVTTFVEGYVKSTNLLVGNYVKKGAIIATLNCSECIDIQKEYSAVAEQITYLKSEFERQKTLFDEKITSQKNYLKAESDYKQAKGIYNSLRQKLQLLNINPDNVRKGKITSNISLFAPISGTISVMNAEIGKYFASSDLVAEIIETNHLHIELEVFEKDILKINEGQIIKFTLPQASTETYFAEVVLVGKSIENNKRTIQVHGHLDESHKQKLLVGMFADAQIVIDSKKAMALPTDAIFTENNKNYVLVVENASKSYNFSKKQVMIGQKTDDFTEIILDKNINEQIKILTKGVFELVE